MNCIKANPLSRTDIQRYALYIRKKVGLENQLYFPILTFTEGHINKLVNSVATVLVHVQ
jgi:hypothetical protein